MTIRGTVVYQDIEGGFWGLTAEDGSRYEPADPLPAAVQTDGCRVEADIEPTGMLSFKQWGRPVRVRNVRRL
jgi:inhibitor of cysteine peptidase